MEEYLDQNLVTFIESVSSSNLETFHSKAISWMLNDSKDNSELLRRLYAKATATGRSFNKIRHIATRAEIMSHDVVTLLRVDSKYELIVLENKIKAGFHQKKWNFKSGSESQKKVNSIVANYNSNWRRGVSQPYYYQLKYLSNTRDYVKTLLSKLRESCDVNIPTESEVAGVNWLVLSPFEKAKLDEFYMEQWQGYSSFTRKTPVVSGDRELVSKVVELLADSDINEWRFCTYKDLFELNDNSGLNKIQKTYLEYLENNEWFRPNREKDGKWSVNELWEIKKEVRKKLPNAIFRWSISGSANSGGPLLNICFPQAKTLTDSDLSRLGLKYPLPNEKNKQSPFINRLTVNIQFQGNAIKLQLSHWDYDNVKLDATSGNYAVEAIKECFGITCSNEKESPKNEVNAWLKESGFEISRENRSKTKSGYSFSLKQVEGGGNDKIVDLCKYIADNTKCLNQ